ncbi:UTP--glucose-1-phosphate uridylyltransferase [bacterium]|nr:UTP--glucose-1-phosphate uridylyltransferase [bacterium]
MNSLVDLIISDDDSIRNQSLESICANLQSSDLLSHADELDKFRRTSGNLYHRVRALFFLSAIHRYYLPKTIPGTQSGKIPFVGYQHLLSRRFVEAIDQFLDVQATQGPSDGLCSAFAEAYHQLGFQTLADQVRKSVRTVHGNQWMFRLGHPADHPLRIRKELLKRGSKSQARPTLREETAVRMDFSHSAWSDIFFLGMDFPQGARVLNASIDLGVCGRDTTTKPPIETYLRVIDEPIFRLVSVDLGASAEVHSISEMFDFARDHLGLLKAAVVASGIVPPGLDGSNQSMAEILALVVGPGNGIELVSQINDIPKGSRLAVSTNLLGSLIAILMRATGQIDSLDGPLNEQDRQLVGARAILGEWIGGSGGGWQDSGGVWPGIKLIEGAIATEGDAEFGISRGRLMPTHRILKESDAPASTREKLQDSLVLVHGGMAQNVGPILEMVTERYLLRSEAEWLGREKAIRILDEIMIAMREGDIRRIGQLTTHNFQGPLQTIIPWATNRFTDLVIETCREKYGDRFWGFWMLGGMSGGGMGFLFDPEIKKQAQTWLADTLINIKRQLAHSLPFAMDPVVYDFKINDRGTSAEFLVDNHAPMPEKYYALMIPKQLRKPLRDHSRDRQSELEQVGQACRSDQSDTSRLLIDSILPRSSNLAESGQSLAEVLNECGFDRQQHDVIRDDLRAGRIGLTHNRLAANLAITDVLASDVTDMRFDPNPDATKLGQQAIQNSEVAVVTLAAGVGSRWTQGAGVSKALHPFYKFAGKHRSFLEVHLAKNRRTTESINGTIPHVVTTSHLTDTAIRNQLKADDQFGFTGPLYISTGKSIGLRTVPMVRDLQFLWEETSQQVLDEQQQRVRESARQALTAWAKQAGEGSDYTDNLPHQCIHPVGHWYEVPNLIINGVLKQMLTNHPSLRYLMLHNIDTLGANVDPLMLGQHIIQQSTLSFEVITRRLEDRGGGLARVDGRPRLVEGLAMPNEEAEFNLTYYNSMTTWIEIDRLLDAMGLSRGDLDNPNATENAVRSLSKRLPTYITLKDVKKRWGNGQEDIYPVAQFEKLWGDMTTLPEIDCQFLIAPIHRGQQLKSQDQLDSWKRDGTADYINSLCAW